MFAISSRAISAASRRAWPRQIITQCQKRNMGLGGSKGPPPKWEGLDKIVRTYLPNDEHVCAAVIGFWFTVILLVKLSSGGKKAAAPLVAAAVSAPTGTIPDIESPDFEKFLNSDAFLKLLENEEQLKGLVA